jgi:hypothetical protein
LGWGGPTDQRNEFWDAALDVASRRNQQDLVELAQE